MIGVRYISLHEESGYGTAARRVMSGLIRQGVPVTWTPMVAGTMWRLGYEPYLGRAVPGAGELAPYCNAPIEYDTVILHCVPEYFPIWRDQLRSLPGASPLVLGHTVWETTRLPAHWLRLLSSVDGLLVPCEWNVGLFRSARVGVPIECLPHPCLEETQPESSGSAADGPFRFYTINQWNPRKAMDRTLRAYLSAFDSNDHVELVVKTSPDDYSKPRGRMTRRFLGRYSPVAPAVSSMLAEFPNPPPIQLVTDSLTRTEILELHAGADAYISLTRAEGWGLGAFDAATLGIPVIMTGFGGQLDYLCRERSGLVDFDLVPVTEWKGGESYTRDQSWAEPRVEHAVELMRAVRADRQGWRRRAQELAHDVRERFSGAHVAAELVETIAKIRAELGGAP